MIELKVLRVLILDDDPMVGALIEIVVQSAGAQSKLTLLPQAFFDAFAIWQPSHIVLDMHMPEMSGHQVLAELAVRGCLVPIILTSGNAFEAEEARRTCDTRLVVAGVLVKPFVAGALRALLGAAPASLFPPVGTVPAG